ncbi:hypothetical protein GCM10007918_08030 [Piscinibacter gummiphilus]|nr:hypothetical protein GCM10007918_08030 [Piscinibacter gummiphilus]
MLNTGKGVPLNDPSRHHELRAYYLFFARCDSSWYVAVARASWCFQSPGLVVTVLTQRQYEHDRGEISSESLSSAARQAIGGVEEFPLAPPSADRELVRRQDVKVVMTGWDCDFTPRRVVLGTPPLPHKRVTRCEAVETCNAASIWPWIQQRTRTLGIDPSFRLERLEVHACGFPVSNLAIGLCGPA